MKFPKIKEFHITPIAVIDPPLLNAAGLHAPYALRTVVELVTEDGISGVSEIPGNIEIDKALEKSRRFIIGLDPFQLNNISDATYKIKIDLMKATTIISSAKKTVDIYGGE